MPMDILCLSMNDPQNKVPETTAFRCCFRLFYMQQDVHSSPKEICAAEHIDNIFNYPTVKLRGIEYSFFNCTDLFGNKN